MIVKQFQTDKEITEWLNDSSNLDQLKEKYPPLLWMAKIDLENKCIIVESKSPSVEPYNDVPLGYGVDEMDF